MANHWVTYFLRSLKEKSPQYKDFHEKVLGNFQHNEFFCWSILIQRWRNQPGGLELITNPFELFWTFKSEQIFYISKKKPLIINKNIKINQITQSPNKSHSYGNCFCRICLRREAGGLFWLRSTSLSECGHDLTPPCDFITVFMYSHQDHGSFWQPLPGLGWNANV